MTTSKSRALSTSAWAKMATVSSLFLVNEIFMKILKWSWISSWNIKYSLESSWRDLQDLHTFAPLRSQNFSQKSSTFFREWINEFPSFFIFSVELYIFLRISDEILSGFRDKFQKRMTSVAFQSESDSLGVDVWFEESDVEWRLSLFNQIRENSEINFVKIIRYDRILFNIIKSCP